MRRKLKHQNCKKANDRVAHSVAVFFGCLAALHVASYDLEPRDAASSDSSSGTKQTGCVSSVTCAYVAMEHARQTLQLGEDLETIGIVWTLDGSPGRLRKFPRTDLWLNDRTEMLNWLSSLRTPNTISGFVIDNPPYPQIMRSVVVSMFDERNGEFNLRLNYELNDENWVKLPLNEAFRIKDKH